MEFTKVFSAKAVAFRQTEDASNKIPFAGSAFFPDEVKTGIDLKSIKSHKNVGLALKPSSYDALATIRPRAGFTVITEEMPLFRESMKVSERDLAEIARAQEANDPYLNEVISNLYNDSAELIEGAEISAERMRMNLLAPINGDVKISIGIADNVMYTYNYDDDQSWKNKNYLELLTGKWDTPASSKPLNDLDGANNVLASLGAIGRYAMMNTATFNYLVQSEQIKNAIITSSGVAVAFVNKSRAKEIVSNETGLAIILNDKTFRDFDGTAKKFYPDGYVTVIGTDILGKTYRGMTPEQRTLAENPAVDVAVLQSGIAIATQTTYGPPVQRSVTASQVCLPSYEGMDAVFVLKVY